MIAVRVDEFLYSPQQLAHSSLKFFTPEELLSVSKGWLCTHQDVH